MKKRLAYMTLFIIIIFSLTGCFSKSINKEISNFSGIKIPRNSQIKYEDTHGGFHGDGATLAKVEFDSNDAENILAQIKDNDNWEGLPLSKNIEIRMYGGKKDSVVYNSDLAERLDMPKVDNGYWMFIDRFDGENRINDDRLLFDRYAANYTIGIYDAESNTLYYCKYDS